MDSPRRPQSSSSPRATVNAGRNEKVLTESAHGKVLTNAFSPTVGTLISSSRGRGENRILGGEECGGQTQSSSAKPMTSTTRRVNQNTLSFLPSQTEPCRSDQSPPSNLSSFATKRGGPDPAPPPPPPPVVHTTLFTFRVPSSCAPTSNNLFITTSPHRQSIPRSPLVSQRRKEEEGGASVKKGRGDSNGAAVCVRDEGAMVCIPPPPSLHHNHSSPIRSIRVGMGTPISATPRAPHPPPRADVDKTGGEGKGKEATREDGDGDEDDASQHIVTERCRRPASAPSRPFSGGSGSVGGGSGGAPAACPTSPFVSRLKWRLISKEGVPFSPSLANDDKGSSPFGGVAPRNGAHSSAAAAAAAMPGSNASTATSSGHTVNMALWPQPREKALCHNPPQAATPSTTPRSPYAAQGARLVSARPVRVTPTPTAATFRTSKDYAKDFPGAMLAPRHHGGAITAKVKRDADVHRPQREAGGHLAKQKSPRDTPRSSSAMTRADGLPRSRSVLTPDPAATRYLYWITPPSHSSNVLRQQEEDHLNRNNTEKDGGNEEGTGGKRPPSPSLSFGTFLLLQSAPATPNRTKSGAVVTQPHHRAPAPPLSSSPPTTPYRAVVGNATPTPLRSNNNNSRGGGGGGMTPHGYFNRLWNHPPAIGEENNNGQNVSLLLPTHSERHHQRQWQQGEGLVASSASSSPLRRHPSNGRSSAATPRPSTASACSMSRGVMAAVPTHIVTFGASFKEGLVVVGTVGSEDRRGGGESGGGVPPPAGIDLRTCSSLAHHREAVDMLACDDADRDAADGDVMLFGKRSRAGENAMLPQPPDSPTSYSSLHVVPVAGFHRR